MIVALVMACAVVVSTSAQDKASAHQQARADKALTYLLKDIKVNDAKKAEIEKLTVNREISMTEIFQTKGLSKEDREAKKNELAAEYRASIAKVIGKGQMEQWDANLKEYQLAMSLEAIADKKLKVMLEDITVTSDQKKQVRDLAIKYENDRRALEQNKDMDATAKKSALFKVKMGYFKDVYAIIGEQQKAQWQENDQKLVESMKKK